MKDLRIVFMGTPSFAAGVLDAMCKNNYNVVGVITAADKPAGRGQKLNYSAVKQYALDNNLNLLQPTNLKDEAFLTELKALNADVQVVVAFRMLPKVVWQMPALGTFNLHASLLPEYRGAAPINWAIINGETKSGVTTFFIDDKIDTGAIILKSEIAIDADDNVGSLHDKLMTLGSHAVVATLEQLSSGPVTVQQQSENDDLKTAPKLTKENCQIDISKSATTIHNFVRGLSPYPAAWCHFNDTEQLWNVRIFETSVVKETHSYAIGQLLSGKKDLKFAVSDGFVNIISLQIPGKKKMTASELLNGMKFSAEAFVS